MLVRIAVAAAAAIVAAAPSTAHAAPPPNDAFADATVVTALPYTATAQLDEATTEPGEPAACSFFLASTVWYRVTPESSGLLSAEVPSNWATLALYRQDGGDMSTLSFRTCSSPFGRATARVEAGETYYVQVQRMYFFGPVGLSFRLVPPPPNDTFADAAPITSLPFVDEEDVLAASTEAGEPSASCWGGYPSVWYTFRAPATGSFTAAALSGYGVGFAVYTGTALASLHEVACRAGVLTFRADAGQTYYVQAMPSLCPWCTSMSFSLDVAPPPSAGFSRYPSDPTEYDTVQFCDTSWDPGQVGFAGYRFDFGDGTTAEGPCASHRYEADGDYTVAETVTTIDGRTATAKVPLSVRTHDVAITKLTVPQSASAGQTRSITVGISNARYPERVAVTLERSVVGGMPEPIGTLTNDVAVRTANRTTIFAFSYTFTDRDAAAGKVTFRVTATIVGARDALPADNEATALPTKVSR
jgi:hypothetical protein